MGKATVAVFATAALVAGACSGGDSVADPNIEPTPTTAIADAATPEPAPTATAVPPTSVPEEPTAAAEPALSEDEAAVVAAWERYVVLSFEARTKAPSADALDYGSYMLGGALDGLVSAVESDRATGRYVVGSVNTELFDIRFNSEGDSIVDGCVQTDLVAYSTENDAALVEEGPLELVARGRLTVTPSGWLVAASELEAGRCED